MSDAYERGLKGEKLPWFPSNEYVRDFERGEQARLRNAHLVETLQNALTDDGQAVYSPSISSTTTRNVGPRGPREFWKDVQYGGGGVTVHTTRFVLCLMALGGSLAAMKGIMWALNHTQPFSFLWCLAILAAVPVGGIALVACIGLLFYMVPLCLVLLAIGLMIKLVQYFSHHLY